MSKLSEHFYLNEDVIGLSRALIGKYLFTHLDGCLTGGRIIETEGYKGPEDRASHAHLNRRTPRTEVMFHKGGICYVYLCYGMHHLLNVVTNQEGIPHAILLRAIEPKIGIETMLQRRRKRTVDSTLASGPGTLTQALGVNHRHNGVPLTGEQIWIEERDPPVAQESILCGPRVGIDYAGEDALLPWRFRLKSGLKNNS